MRSPRSYLAHRNRPVFVISAARTPLAVGPSAAHAWSTHRTLRSCGLGSLCATTFGRAPSWLGKGGLATALRCCPSAGVSHALVTLMLDHELVSRASLVRHPHAEYAAYFTQTWSGFRFTSSSRHSETLTEDCCRSRRASCPMQRRQKENGARRHLAVPSNRVFVSEL